MNNWNRAKKLTASAALVAGGLMIGLALAGASTATGGEPQEAQQARMADSTSGMADMVPQGAFVRVAEELAPTVVFIEAERPAERQEGNGMERFFDFFGRGAPEGEEDEEGGDAPDFEDLRRSQGSGVIISADGYIMTNAHVIASFNARSGEMDMASSVTVTLSDDMYYDAEIVGADLGTDIALLKVDAEGLRYARIGDSEGLRVGEWVMAIGAPFGLQNTVSAGIVSALGRANLQGMNTSYQDFVQTDAAINPGNSGGPLVDLNGEIIGINTAIASGGGFNPSFSGVGFAVPSNIARRVMEQLRDHGRVIRGYLGVTVQVLTRDMREAYDLDPRTRGAIINGVNEGGPAETAGVEPGDIVIAVDGDRLQSQQDFLQRVAGHMPGDSVELTVVRGDAAGQETVNLTVTLTERPAENEVLASQLGLTPQPNSRGGDEAEDEISMSARRLGMRVSDLTDQLAEQLQIDSTMQGVVITDVAQNSPAAVAGLSQGDVVLRVGRQVITNADEFESAVAGYAAGDVMPLYVFVARQGSALFLPLRIPAE
jgi:serine protease Do